MNITSTDINQLVNYLGILGIGSTLGILLKSFIDRNLNDRKMLFDARIKAYSGITGRVFNLFQELDIQRLSDPEKFTKINNIFSEVMLVGSKDLIELVAEYKHKVFLFHVAVGRKNDNETKELHEKLMKLVGLIHSQMRRDINL